MRFSGDPRVERASLYTATREVETPDAKGRGYARRMRATGRPSSIATATAKS